MTTPVETAEAPRRSSRWITYALTASLALNLLVAGVIASAWWRFKQEAPFAGTAVNANLMGYTATLPADRRQAIMRATGGERRLLGPLRAEVRNARLAARAALLAEPFEPERFARAQTTVLEAEVRARTEAHKLFLAIASSLTREERQAFAGWQQPAEGPPKGRGGWWQRRDRGFEDRERRRPSSPSATEPVVNPR